MMRRNHVPRIDLRLLRQLVAVAEELHFRRASERLAMSQPPLTAAIRRLEEEIGAVLIERGRTAVRLTEAGKVLLDEARRLLEAAEDALSATRDAAEGKRGRVRLGYVGSAMYGRLANELRRAQQETPDLRLELWEMTTTAQLTALRSGEIDLAIVIPPLRQSDDLVTTPFDEDCLAIALPAAHRLAGRADVALSDLSDEHFVIWPREQGPGFHDQVTRLCRDAGFVLDVAQEAYGMHGVLSLVAVGVGIALVPAGMASVRADEIVYRPIEGEAAAFEVWLCRRPVVESPAVLRLADALSR
jgi:DNA-binding transcriptional LysR family regulator